ncbi:hypothetical protein Q8A73_017926 [Channa argus]|nr:hypothetical protein Q8A73_017926 [Channa argus]
MVTPPVCDGGISQTGVGGVFAPVAYTPKDTAKRRGIFSHFHTAQICTALLWRSPDNPKAHDVHDNTHVRCQETCLAGLSSYHQTTSFTLPIVIPQPAAIEVDWCVCGPEYRHLLATQRQLAAFVAKDNKQNRLTPPRTMEGCVDTPPNNKEAEKQLKYSPFLLEVGRVKPNKALRIIELQLFVKCRPQEA